MEDHLKEMRKIADRVLFNDQTHKNEIIEQIKQRVRVSPVKSVRRWPGAVRYVVNGSILALFVLTFAFILINKLDIFGQDQSSLKKHTASIDDTIHYDPATFKGLVYTGLATDYGLEQAQKLGITQDFQKTITYNNVQFKIEDVYFDGATFAIAYDVKNHEAFDETKEPMDQFTFMVNNTKPNGSYGIEFLNNGKKISANEYKGICLVSLEHPDNKFTLNLTASSLKGMKGEWKVDIPVSIDKVKNSIAVFYPDYKTTWQGGEITVKKVMYTPSAIVIDLNNMVKGSIQEVMGSNIIQYSLLTPAPEADAGFGGQGVPLNNGKVLIQDFVGFTPKSNIPNELTLKAYNSKDGSEVHRFTFPLVKKGLTIDSNNALAVELDGKKNLVPAEIVNNVGIVKEIKIPVNGLVRNIDEHEMVHKTASGMIDLEVQPFIFETASSKMMIKESQMTGTIQDYFNHFKPTEQNSTVPAVKVDMDKYPQLKGYDGMVKVEGKYLTEYYLVKSFEIDEQKKIREVKIQAPTSSSEGFLLKMIGSLATAKFNS